MWNILSALALAAPEDPMNGIDEDGDGADAIRQELRSNFSSGAPPAGWTTSGGTALGLDAAQIPAMGTLRWSGNYPFIQGDLYVALDLDAYAGTCTGSVTWHESASPTVRTSHLFTLVADDQVHAIPAPTNIGIDVIEIKCGMGSSATLDWLVLQNGTMVYAPVGDVNVEWSDTDTPFGGNAGVTTLRGIYLESAINAEGLIAASDVGGIGFWNQSDGVWEVRNGTWPHMLYQSSELAMTDVIQTQSGEVLGLSGETTTSYVCSTSVPDDCSPAVRGRLMATSDEGASWYPEADSFQVPGVDTPAVAANRRISPYMSVATVDEPATWPKTYAAGRLLENVYSSTLIANHIPETSDVAGFPALALREDGVAGAPADICPLTNVLDSSLEPPAPKYDGVIGWSNVVSALTVINYPIRTLLVGYRQRDLAGTGTSAADHSSLWRCPLYESLTPSCADYEFDVECYPVVGGIGLDVSDIEITTRATTTGTVVTAWVADYGLRNTSGSCDAADLMPECQGDVLAPGVWRWDLDLAEPTGINDIVTDVTGPIAGEWEPVSGLLAGTDFLYAFRPYDRDQWYSDKPRIWRLSIADAEAGSDDWITLSEDYITAADWDPNLADSEEIRDAFAYPSDTWADDQEALGNWASTIDGVEYWGDVVGGGMMGVWLFMGLDSAMFDGRNAPLWDDSALNGFGLLDHADYSGATTLQTTVDNAAAFADDGRLHVASADMGYYRQDAAGRGVAPPQAEVMNAHGHDVSVVTYNTPGQDGIAVWVSNSEGVLRSDDNGETFCYQSDRHEWPMCSDTSDAFQWSYIGSRYDLFESTVHAKCENYGSSVAGFADWPACDATLWSTAPTEQGRALYTWGTPTSISGLDASVALVSFKATGGTGALAYTLDGSTTWTRTTGSPAGVFGETPSMELIRRNSHYTSPTDWHLEVIHGTAGVGIYRVVIDAASAPTATWTLLDLGGCTNWRQPTGVDAQFLRGIAVSPWADSFVAYGGWVEYVNGQWGGACLSDLDGLNETTLIHPSDPNYQYSIGGVVPHPFLYNTWFIAPIVLSSDPNYCVRDQVGMGWDYDWDAYFTACADPFPRMIQKQSSGLWRSAPISIAGLPSLKAIHLTAGWADGGGVELAYSTQGSGTFRGATSW